MKSATPKKPARSQQRSVETRGVILEAAARIFAESGLAGARTEAIAAAAGVNKALLYYYFKDKESLYVAVVEDHFRAFNDEAVELLTSPGSARTILLKYAGLHFDFIASRARYAPLYQQLMTTGGKPLKHLVQKYLVPRSKALDALLERGMRGREFRRADRMHAAVSLAGVIVFYFSAAPVLNQLGHGDPFGKATLKRRKQETLDFIRHGLFLKPEAPL